MYKLKLIFLLLGIVYIQESLGQTFTSYFELDNIVDNREFFTKYGYSQTILGSRLNIIAGIDIDSTHSFKGGINYMYEYGANIDEVPSQINLFYSYKKNNIKAYLGSFPRKKLLKYPLIMLRDTLNYYRPNIDGAFLQFSGKKSNLAIWSDWTGRKSNTRREAFLAGFFGNVKFNQFYLDYYAYMFHNAADAILAQSVEDNGVGAIFLGIDLRSFYNLFQKFQIDFGAISSFDRVRPNPLIRKNGFMSRINIQYKNFGTDATLYFGDSQNLPYGDQLYRAKNYHRIDLFWIPFKTANISSRISFNAHLVNGDFNTSQQISIIAHFASRKKIR